LASIEGVSSTPVFFVFAQNKVAQTEKTGVDETPSIEANQIDAAP